MIYDRDYMQTEYDPRDSAVARPLIIAVVIGFIAQAIVSQWIPGGAAFLLDHVVLSLANIRSFEVWTVLTYPLLESGIDGWSVISVVFNAIMLHLFARTLVPVIGRRGFWTVVAGAVLLGAALTLTTAAIRGLGGFAVSASTIVLALLTVFACLQPDRPISFLLAFVIPVTIKPKYLAWFIAGLALFGFIFFELQARPFATPPSNLLGGMLAGWLFHRFVHQPGAVFQSSGPRIEMPAWMKRKKRVAVATAATQYTVNVSTPAQPTDIRAEVDRILDKINSKGFGALTAEERRVLDEARDTLNKR